MARNAAREARLLPFVGLLTISYLVVGAIATSRGLDGGSVILLIVAALGAISPRWFLRRDELRPAKRERDLARGERGPEGRLRLSWLGLATAAIAVARASSAPSGGSGGLSLEIAEAIAVPLFGALLVDLALVLPDPLPRPRRARLDPRRWLRGATLLGAATAATLGVIEAFSGFEVPNVGLVLVPHTVGRLGVGLLLFALLASLTIRAMRRNGEGDPVAIAANASALAGLVVASAAAAALVLAWASGVPERSLLARVGVAIVLAGVLAGHLAMVDEGRPIHAARALRQLVSGVLALAVVALATLLVRESATSAWSWLDWSARGILVALVAGASHAFFSGVVARALAPDRGHLLFAARAARARVERARGLQEMAEAVLAPMRRTLDAEGDRSHILCLDPPLVARIDAAGAGHVERHEVSAALVSRLLERPLEVIVAKPIVEQAVRRPDLRPLVAALVDADALVVVPLTSAPSEDALEGALVIARGGRRAAVTLEEIATLEGLGRELGVRLASWAAAERAQRRAGEALLTAARLEERVATLEDELGALGLARDADEEAPFAYTPSSRRTLRALEEAGQRDTPLLVTVERGTAARPWIEHAHRRGPRRAHPFVTLECAELADEALETRVLHALREAGRGTLVLFDVVALPLSLQALLAEAIATRTIRIGRETHPLWSRLVATAERPREGDALRLHPELARRFGAQTFAIPTLRERLADARSLALRAIERACRRGGRELVGIEEEAMGWLEGHALDDGERGLERAIERAVAITPGPRIRIVDLERALALPGIEVGDDPLDATLAEVEERAILRALARASGNKSEAARLLGLKRTTFLDRLRRLGIDDDASRPEA